MRIDSIEVAMECTLSKANVLVGDARSHIEFLKRYIPGAIHNELEAGHDPNTLGEIRQVSIVFLQIKGITLEAAPGSSKDIHALPAWSAGQTLMLLVQDIMYTWQGSINKMTIDDKGLVFIIVFGLKPMVHPDDPRRAVCFAQTAVERIPLLGKDFNSEVVCRVGITTGHTFCGVVGSPKRREYTVMGMLVNLAARLMCKAPPNGILVDERTRKHKLARMPFDELDPQHFKGFEKVQRNYRPTGPEPVVESKAGKKAYTALVKQFREPQLAKVRNIMVNQTPGQCVVIIGDRGSGKSEVFKDVIRLGHENEFVVLDGEAAIKTGIAGGASGTGSLNPNIQPKTNHPGPYFSAWKPIYHQLLQKLSEDSQCPPVDVVRWHLNTEKPSHLALLTIMLPELAEGAEGLKIPARDDSMFSPSGDLATPFVQDERAFIFGTPATTLESSTTKQPRRQNSRVLQLDGAAEREINIDLDDIDIKEYWHSAFAPRCFSFSCHLSVYIRYFGFTCVFSIHTP